MGNIVGLLDPVAKNSMQSTVFAMLYNK